MYVSWRLALLAVVASVPAALLPSPVWVTLLVVNGGLAALVALDVVRAPRAASLSMERESPTVSGLGRTERAAVRIHNPLDRPLEVALRDAAPASLRRDPVRQRAIVAGRSWRTLEAELIPSRRGYAEVGPITLRTAGPLRLAGRQTTVRESARIKVYPKLPGRAHVAARIERARELQSGSRSSAFRGGGSDFDSLRDYHPDDEFRRINWSATARAGTPITNVYREERDQQIILMLDAGRAMAGSVADTSRFELAIDAGFALAELATYVGDRVGMVAFGGRVLRMIGPRGGRDQPRRILDLLFDLEPVLEAPDYRGAFASTLSRYRRRAMLVLLTELTEERAMDPLFTALPSLLSRHVVVVAALQDPVVTGFAAAEPTDSEGAYRKAAAVESLARRERAAARLRAMGVGVEDRLPGELAAGVADRYLSIKSAGRL
jgi:uncharacterized protein (DUF58 family)